MGRIIPYIMEKMFETTSQIGFWAYRTLLTIRVCVSDEEGTCSWDMERKIMWLQQGLFRNCQCHGKMVHHSWT